MEIRRSESKWSEPLNSQTSIDVLGETNAVRNVSKEEEKERKKGRKKKKRLESNDKQ